MEPEPQHNFIYYRGFKQKKEDTFRKKIRESVPAEAWTYMRVEGVPLWPLFIMSIIETKIGARTNFTLFLLGNLKVKEWLTFYGTQKLPQSLSVIDK